ncbi:hypothetical protein [Sorangium sp. So ce426]|uniref:hypothetical protein n=1 Tax=Sorangium sp. So ce426 TaxID=3133312 RepID=UPI003F5C9CD7
MFLGLCMTLSVMAVPRTSSADFTEAVYEDTRSLVEDLIEEEIRKTAVPKMACYAKYHGLLKYFPRTFGQAYRGQFGSIRNTLRSEINGLLANAVVVLYLHSNEILQKNADAGSGQKKKVDLKEVFSILTRPDQNLKKEDMDAQCQSIAEKDEEDAEGNTEKGSPANQLGERKTAPDPADIKRGDAQWTALDICDALPFLSGQPLAASQQPLPAPEAIEYEMACTLGRITRDSLDGRERSALDRVPTVVALAISDAIYRLSVKEPLLQDSATKALLGDRQLVAEVVETIEAHVRALMADGNLNLLAGATAAAPAPLAPPPGTLPPLLPASDQESLKRLNTQIASSTSDPNVYVGLLGKLEQVREVAASLQRVKILWSLRTSGTSAMGNLRRMAGAAGPLCKLRAQGQKDPDCMFEPSALLDELARLADVKDYWEMLGRILKPLNSEESELCKGDRKIYCTFALRFASYSIDAVDDGAVSVEVRVALRQSILDIVRSTGQIGGMNRPIFRTRWYRSNVLVPDFALRLSWNSAYINESDGNGFRYTPSVEALSLRGHFWYTNRVYIGADLAFVDAVAPFQEFALRKADVNYRHSSRPWANFLNPRLDLLFGAPFLTRKLALAAGASWRTTVAIAEPGGEHTTYAYWWDQPRELENLSTASFLSRFLEMNIGIKYMP